MAKSSEEVSSEVSVWKRFNRYYSFLKGNDGVVHQIGHAMLGLLYCLELMKEGALALFVVGDIELSYVEALLQILNDSGFETLPIPIYLPRLAIDGENLLTVGETQAGIKYKLNQSIHNKKTMKDQLKFATDLMRFFGDRDKFRNLTEEDERLEVRRLSGKLEDILYTSYLPSLIEEISLSMFEYLNK
jgi:hypothetical protein